MTEENANFTIKSWSLTHRTDEEKPPPARTPDDIWPFPPSDEYGPGGTAWVYYSNKDAGLVNPVILTDGFETGATELDKLWHGLDRLEYAFATKLLEQGKDLILLGYENRSASILENAKVAIACIKMANDKKSGGAQLVVGGFSMGGIVTRYALAKMEHDGPPHQASTYISYDSPHRGAWIPPSVQAFAHYFKNKAPDASAQINSMAARQMLQYHIATHNSPQPIGPAPERAAFLTALRDVGWWPKNVSKILGVASGTGDGSGNGVDPGIPALEWVLSSPIGDLASVTLNTQSQGEGQVVAKLYQALKPKYSRETNGIPDLDGAPGGTLNTIEIAANALEGATANVPSICFVPSVSAVAIRDITDHESAYVNISELDPKSSELTEFMCSRTNTFHASITEELATWILEKLK